MPDPQFPLPAPQASTLAGRLARLDQRLDALVVAQDLQAARLDAISATQEQLADGLERAGQALDQITALLASVLDPTGELLRLDPAPASTPCRRTHLFAVPPSPAGGRVRPKGAGR